MSYASLTLLGWQETIWQFLQVVFHLNNCFPSKFTFFYYMKIYFYKHYRAGDTIPKKPNRLGLSAAPLLQVKSWMGLPEVEDWEV